MCRAAWVYNSQNHKSADKEKVSGNLYLLHRKNIQAFTQKSHPELSLHIVPKYPQNIELFLNL